MSSLRSIYLGLIIVVGIILSGIGIVQAPIHDKPTVFVLMLCFAALVELSPTVEVKKISSHIGSAIWLAAMVVLGPFAAAVVVAGTTLAAIAKSIYRNGTTSLKKTLTVAGFNHGAWTISIFAANFTYILLQEASFALPWNQLWSAIVWTFAAVVYEQLNLFIIIAIRRLSGEPSSFKMWLEGGWAMPLNIALDAIGGGIFARAVMLLGGSGVIIFGLPIALTSYSFWIYARQTKAQMDRLEDIVEERTEELRVTNGELNSALERQQNFVAVLSHDMRTPLTAIRLYAKMLRDQSSAPAAKRKRMAQVVLLNESSLTEMVENLLDSERLRTTDELQLDCETLNLSEIAEKAMVLIEAQAVEKSISMAYIPPIHPVFVVGDQRTLQRVIVNLLSNAVKYTPENGSVQLAVEHRGLSAAIVIADTGYGIPEDALTTIFEPFKRVQEHVGKARGTGLGLSIVKRLVEAHKGKIEVESKVDKGSTFTVRLPALVGRENVEWPDSAELPPLFQQSDNSANATSAQSDTPPSSPHPRPNE